MLQLTIMNRLLLLTCGLLCVFESNGITYDVATEFSATANPNGTWSYGWRDAGGFHLFTERREVAPNVLFWTGGDGPLGEPTAGKNEGSTSTAVSPTMSYEPGEFALHPGRAGQMAVVRWTSPETRIYNIDVLFAGVDDVGTTTDVHVTLDGVEFSSGIINGATSVAFSGEHLISEGDQLEFVVGFGANQTFWSDTTRLEVRIASVPDAGSTLVCLGMVLPILVVMRDSNRRCGLGWRAR